CADGGGGGDDVDGVAGGGVRRHSDRARMAGGETVHERADGVGVGEIEDGQEGHGGATAETRFGVIPLRSPLVRRSFTDAHGRPSTSVAAAVEGGGIARRRWPWRRVRRRREDRCRRSTTLASRSRQRRIAAGAPARS